MTSRHILAVHLAASLVAAAVFATSGGLPGFAWAVVILGGGVILPPPLVFVLGQFGVAATTPTGAALVLAELALAIPLVADVVGTAPTRRPLLAGGATAGLIAVIPWALGQAAQWATLFYLAVTLATILYGVHRYELYVTGQLNS
jgi:hypothetical protein